MSETSQLVALWHKAQARAESVCLATVVHVQGSSYRKPGARMLVTAGGERAGTISGGCLEGEVSRKAWWLTSNGPGVQQYRSSFEEDPDGGPAEVPWGLGCGGTLWVLLERDPVAVLEALEASIGHGVDACIISSLQPDQPGTRLVLAAQAQFETNAITSAQNVLHQAALTVLETRRHLLLDANGSPFPQNSANECIPDFFAEYLAPPPRLTIFGAGDDAQPIASFAATLGWRVTVADGRSQLLRPERFPEGVALRLLHYGPGAVATCSLQPGEPQQQAMPRLVLHPSHAKQQAAIPAVSTGLADGDFAVLLTHSFEQDRALLAALLPGVPGRTPYLGILGPLHRTERLLQEVAPQLGLSIDECLARLHAPIGLNLGAREPAAIALSIVAELQATLNGRHVLLTAKVQPMPTPRAIQSSPLPTHA